MKKIMACLTVVMGTIIGAGFASGKEIITFFVLYGKNGLYGVFLTTIIMDIVLIRLMYMIYKSGTTTYTMLTSSSYFQVMSKALFFSCLCMMFAASGALFSYLLNISFWYGSIFMSIVCYLVLVNQFYGIQVINDLLLPVIVVGIIMLCLESRFNLVLDLWTRTTTFQWGISAMLYAGFNLLVLLPIIEECQVFQLSVKQILTFGLMFLVLHGGLMAGVFLTAQGYVPHILEEELPNMYIASFISDRAKFIYGLVMLGAISTTACSCGFSYLKLNGKKNDRIHVISLCLFALFCSKIGFSQLIHICYPLLGVSGLVQVGLILFRRKGKYA